MKYQDGIVLKNGLIPATKEEVALYFEQEEIKRQLKSLPKHDRLSRFLHSLFKLFIPDHKKAIERRISLLKPKPKARLGSQNPSFNPDYIKEIVYLKGILDNPVAKDFNNNYYSDDVRASMRKRKDELEKILKKSEQPLSYKPTLKDTTTYLTN